MSALMFLLKLAWESRYRLPLIITVGFMAFDVRMQLEINVSVRRVRRNTNYLTFRNPDVGNQDLQIDAPYSEDESDSDSWLTEDEEYTLSEASEVHEAEAVAGSSNESGINHFPKVYPKQTMSRLCESRPSQTDLSQPPQM